MSYNRSDILNQILKRTAVIFLLGTILLMFPASGTVILNETMLRSDNLFLPDSEYSAADENQRGYTSVIKYNDGFLAAGSDGRIDRISVSGKIFKTMTFPGEEFKCLFSDEELIIAAGDKGILRISADGEIFRKIDIGSVRKINSLTIFNGTIICGTDQGVIIAGDTGGFFKETKLNLKGNIVSVSSSLTDCYGVTDQGEIIHSKDGVHWDIIDFNEVYKGYYRPCSFTSILVTQNRISVAGKQDDGSPVVAFSSQGNVWTERILSYTDDNGFREFLTEIPGSIIYDEPNDQYFLACSNGTLLLLPSCSQCNKVTKVSDKNLRGLSFNGDKMLVVGVDFFIGIMNIGW